ncbi:MAG: ROK family protein [Pseudomonadales bacterium]
MQLGIDLGGTKIAAAVLETQGEMIWQHRLPTPTGNYGATVQDIASLVHKAEKELGVRCTVGVATPGSTSPTTGLMRNCNSTCLNGKDLGHDLQVALDRPIRMANDANCFALSEAVDGAGSASACVFGAILGTGVGGGLVLDKQLLRGKNAIAGEWGHNPVPFSVSERESRPCYCGRNDCIETWLSGPALAQSYAQVSRSTRNESAERVVSMASNGDSQASQVLDAYIDDLAQAFATIVNTLDPDIIILGGGVGQISRLLEELPQKMTAYVFADDFTTPIVRPRYGAASGVRGAARLFPAYE